MKRTLWVSLLAAAAACGDDDLDQRAGEQDDDPTGCPRQPAAADRPRFIVVSQPYSETAGQKERRYEVLALSTSGAITPTGHTFETRTTVYGDITFTPDGELGIIGQSDNNPPMYPGGTLGVFRLAADGTPTVIHEAFDTGGYLEYVLMDPSGERVYGVDVGTRDNGGGIYAARIECDGTLTSEGLLLRTDNASQVLLLGDGRQIVVARGIYDSADQLISPTGSTMHLVQGFETLLASADPFVSDDVTAWSIAATRDGQYVLAGDVNYFSGTPAVAVARIGASSLTAVQTLGVGVSDFDPVGIHFSPYGNGGVIVSGFNNEVYRVAYDAGATSTPFELVGPLSYSGGAPLLPGRSVMIERGGLAGLVLFVETEGVRRVRMSAAGAADLGLTPLSTLSSAIGVQP